MNEKRFLRVLMIILILFLGTLLAYHTIAFAQLDPEEEEKIRRTSAILPYMSYPTYGVYTGVYPWAGAGAVYPGVYPGMAVVPLTQQISLAQITPFTSSTLDAYSYRDPLTMYGTQASTFTNPFATYGSTAMQYADPFSQAAANTMEYHNIFGVSMSAGQGYYRDPVYMTAGKYMNYTGPAGGYSFDQAMAVTPIGMASHVSTELVTPLTYYGTSINTAAGLTGAGISVDHAAFGVPVTQLGGQLTLMAAGPELSQMNRALANQYMYTAEGMPFIANVAYYNPASVGGTNWYFAGDISSSAAAVGMPPPVTAGTGVGVTTALYNNLGTSAALMGGAFLGGSGGISTAATTGGSAAAFAGWGTSGGAVFGTTSGGSLGLSGGSWGGGWSGGGGVFGGGIGGGSAFGVGGGSMGGGSYGGVAGGVAGAGGGAPAG